MRKWISILLLAALLATLTACGKASTAEDNGAAGETAPIDDSSGKAAVSENAKAQLPEETQKQILEANQSLWEFTEPCDSPWFYTFTDLDHNGWLEVISATTQGTGIFTYGSMWEVMPDGSGISNCYHENVEIEGPDDWPEIILDSLPCYYDSVSDSYFYSCEGVTRSGYVYQYYAWYALCLNDGTAEWEFLASKTVEWHDEGEGVVDETTCEDAAGNIISEQDYDMAVERRFAGMEKTELKLDWTQVDIPWPDEAYTEPESAEADDTTETAAAAPIPTVPQNDQQTAAQIPTGPAVVITKNPTSEAIAIGGRTWFIAHANNARSLSWRLISPEGAVYTLEQAMAQNPGLTLQALEGDTLAVSNVPLSLNGWGIQAWFDGEGTYAVTEPAYLYVGDFVTAYAGPIEAYRTAYSTGNNRNAQYMWDHELSEMASISTGVGYALKDMDKNGIPELLIAGMGAEEYDSGHILYALYTLVNGQPVNLATSSARMRYYFRTDNSILYESSGGAAYSYVMLERLNGTALEDLEMVFTNMDGEGTANPSVGFYYQQGHTDSLPSGKSVRITEDDFSLRWDQWRSSVYTPPLTTIY